METLRRSRRVASRSTGRGHHSIGSSALTNAGANAPLTELDPNAGDTTCASSTAKEAAAAASPPAKRRRNITRPPATSEADRAGAPAAPAPAAAALCEQPGEVGRRKRRQQNEPAAASAAVAAGPSRAAEQRLWALGRRLVAGVDEAGRGPLAGPVVAAACIIPPDVHIQGVDDSKALDEAAREELYAAITSHPQVAWAAHVVDHTIIDEVNILQATLRAMAAAVLALPLAPDHVLLDGNRRPPAGLLPAGLPVDTIIKGDASCVCIAAASIIAKVTRDRLMLQYDRQYPQYGFAKHKGYGVAAHRAAIERHGPCAIHRTSFQPVKGMLAAPAAAAGRTAAAPAGAAASPEAGRTAAAPAGVGASPAAAGAAAGGASAAVAANTAAAAAEGPGALVAAGAAGPEAARPRRKQQRR